MRNVGSTAAVSATAVSPIADSWVSSRNRRAGSRGGWSIAPGAGGSETKATDAPTSMNSSRMTMWTGWNGAGDRRVGVVDEHEIGRLAGEIGPASAHGDADVRRGECRRVVDAIAGDGDRLSAVLEKPDEPQLVLGRGAGDDGLAAKPLGALVVV